MNEIIRNDLLSGSTIEEVLLKYHISFKELFNMFKDYDVHPYARKEVEPNLHNILERNGSFTVRKSIKGKTKIFGVYNSLSDAVVMREALKKDGWHQRHVDKLCAEMGIERRKNHANCKVSYH